MSGLEELGHTDFDNEDVQIIDYLDNAELRLFKQVLNPFPHRVRIPLPNPS